jgi:hypothetical protein
LENADASIPILASFLVPTMSLSCAHIRLCSLAAEQKINVYRCRYGDGWTHSVGSIAVEVAPGSLAIDPMQKVLFASLRTNSKLASFAIDSDTGKLKHLSTIALPKGENAASVGTDRTGRWLLSALIWHSSRSPDQRGRYHRNARDPNREDGKDCSLYHNQS